VKRHIACSSDYDYAKYAVLYDHGFTPVGFSQRSTGYRNKQHFDPHFHKFLQLNNLPPPTAHLYAHANEKAELPSLQKYAKPCPGSVDMEALQLASNWLHKHFFPIMCNSVEMTHDEAWTLLDKTASAGYPWSLKYPTKNAFYAAGGSSILDAFWEKLEEGDAWSPIWTDAVKAEIRPIDKVLNNKLRTFCASPVEHVHACARACGDMNAKFYNFANRHQKGFWSCVGMSKFYRGWNSLANRLLRDGFNLGISLDVSEYDSSVNVFIFNIIRLFRQRCNPSNANKITTLYREIINTLMILCDGTLMRKSTGNPSGSENTVVDNTLGLYLLLSYCFIVQYKRRFGSYPTYSLFTQNVEAALYGDDNTFTASTWFWSWFDLKEMRSDALSLGFKLTADNDDFVPKPLSELTFLSQRFHFETHLSIWVPVPSKSRIISSMLYGSAQRDMRFSLLRASALLIEGYFNVAVRAILQNFINFILQHNLPEGIVYQDITYSQILANVRTRPEILGLYMSRMETVSAVNGSHSMPFKNIPCLEQRNLVLSQKPLPFPAKQSANVEILLDEPSAKLEGQQ